MSLSSCLSSIFLAACFPLRLAKTAGFYLVKGSGQNQPMGFLSGLQASGCNYVVASGGAQVNDGLSGDTNASTVGSTDIYNLFKSLDEKIRQRAVWYMGVGTLDELSSLVSKEGLPLVKLNRALDDGDEPTLLNRKVCICNSMPSVRTADGNVLVHKQGWRWSVEIYSMVQTLGEPETASDWRTGGKGCARTAN